MSKPLGFSVARLVISDGTEIEPETDATIVFVGPTNAGKSQILRDIADSSATGDKGVVATEVSLNTPDIDAALEWLSANSQLQQLPGQDPHYYRMGHGVHAPSVQRMLLNGPPFQGLSRLWVLRSGVEERLTGAAGVGVPDFASSSPSHPLHYLHQDVALESELADEVQRAFRTRVFLDRTAGAVTQLRLGAMPDCYTAGGLEIWSSECIEEVRRHSSVDTQGDGMRSYVGLATMLCAVAFPVTLIDEPEAFLHPPQEVAIGRLLGRQRANAQVFVATHSSDVIRGLLDVDGANVSVVRLRRAGEVNHAKQLDNASLRKTWSDPLLRYSNVLDGLFHDGVIVCEGDPDCRFYNSLLSEEPVAPSSGGGNVEPSDTIDVSPDILFTHSGGKDRMAVIVEALMKLDVPVRSICDFDILNDIKTLRRLVGAHGGDWRVLESDYNTVSQALTARTKTPTRAYVRENLLEVLDATQDEMLSSRDIKKIRDMTNSSSGWASAKSDGLDALPNGPVRKAGEDLLAALREQGIFVIPSGELESWIPLAGDKGNRWLRDVFAQRLHVDQEKSRQAREFTYAVQASFPLT